MKTEILTKAEAPSIELLRMAAEARLLKAHIDPYKRSDGTKVKGHERDTGAKPKAAKPFAEQAREHAQYATRHETSAARLGPTHPKHGLHVQAAALHAACAHHAQRAGDTTLDAKTRESAAAAHASAKKLLVRVADALLAAQPTGTTSENKLNGILARPRGQFCSPRSPSHAAPTYPICWPRWGERKARHSHEPRTFPA